jgi:hypothetical protein
MLSLADITDERRLANRSQIQPGIVAPNLPVEWRITV